MHYKKPTVLAKVLKQLAEDSGVEKVIGISLLSPDLKAVKGDVIVMAELEQPVLLDVTDEDMEAIKTLVNSCDSLLWVTSGGLMSHTNPEHVMAAGLFRTLNKEVASTQFQVLDLEQSTCKNMATEAARTILACQVRLAHSTGVNDVELRQDKQGVVHCSRIAPDANLNAQFTGAPSMKIVPLEGQPPLKLQIQTPGMLDSLYWTEDDTVSAPLQGSEVIIEVKAAGLNAKVDQN